MGKIERNRDGSAALGAKPLVAEVANRFYGNVFGGQLGIEFFDARFELGAGDLELQITNACLQKFFVAEGGEIGQRALPVLVLVLLASEPSIAGYFNRAKGWRLARFTGALVIVL